MKTRSLGFVAALLLAFVTPALAAAPPIPPGISVPALDPLTLSVTTSTANVTLLDDVTVYPAITIVNNGPNEAFVQIGAAACTASTSSYRVTIPANGFRAIWGGSAICVAAITSSGTATLRITQSNGAPTLGYTGVTGGGAPTGAAGGDLGGTYPNPTVLSVAHVTTGVLPAANGGAGTITGALKANGSGTVSQAASTDLSDTASIARSSNNLSFFSATTSAQLAGVISDETGSGAAVFATSPSITGCANSCLTNSSVTIGTTSVALGASATAFVGLTALTHASAAGWQLPNGAASATSPTFLPNRANSTTGIGAQASGNMSLIAGATEITRITSTGPLLITIPSDSGQTDANLCVNTTTHIQYSGSGTLGACLGTSSARFKHDIRPLTFGLRDVMNLKPVSFRYNKGVQDGGKRKQFWFVAEDVAKSIPEIVQRDSKGRPNTVDELAIIPILVKAIQQQQKQIADLQAQLGMVAKRKGH